jgi:hypothetical protein
MLRATKRGVICIRNKNMEDTKTRETQRDLRIGGVLRCCEETLRRYQATHEPEPIGQRLKCLWCESSLIVAPDGVWEWERAESR